LQGSLHPVVEWLTGLLRRHSIVKQKPKDQGDAIEPELHLPRGYVIRIPKKRNQERAILALLRVPFAYSSVSADEFILLEQHVEALRQFGIPFEDVTGPMENDG
jgi:hypothetical protein